MASALISVMDRIKRKIAERLAEARKPMRYEVRGDTERLSNLSGPLALAKARELIENGENVHIYDHYGDPLGLAQLENEAELNA